MGVISKVVGLSIVLIVFTISVSAQNSDSLFSASYDYEYIPDIPLDSIQIKMNEIEGEIALDLNSRVKAFIDYFTVRNRDYTRGVLSRTQAYFPVFEKHLAENNLPDELKYLSIIESGLRAHALSRASAAGLWQFIPSTGRLYGLSSTWYIDERLDPEKSTIAACKYLKSLYDRFDNWHLALAAYNAGPGKVNRAIRKSGYSKDFWKIYRWLPRETRSYVPQFIAMVYVMNSLEEHHFFADEPYITAIETDTLRIDSFFNLRPLAEELNICKEDLLFPNPELHHGVIPEGYENYTLRVPVELAELIREDNSKYLAIGSTGKEKLIAKAKNSLGSTYGREKIVYRVRSGDVVGTIAERFGVRAADIRSWNRLRGNLIRVGQRLAIWVRPNYLKKKSASSPPRTVASRPITIPDNAKLHVVQPGESLWEIAKLYQGLSIEKIKNLNNLKTSRIKPGQQLIIG